MRKLITGIAGGAGLVALAAACGGTVVNTAPAATNTSPVAPAPAPTATGSAPTSSGSAPPPASIPAGGFLAPSVLAQSVANQQQAALAAAPAYDYTSADDAAVTVSCQSLGSDTFSCSGADSDGDSGNDTVTVSSDGSSWSDSGMKWSGPDIYPDGGVTNYWTTPAVTNWTAA